MLVILQGIKLSWMPTFKLKFCTEKYLSRELASWSSWCSGASCCLQTQVWDQGVMVKYNYLDNFFPTLWDLGDVRTGFYLWLEILRARGLQDDLRKSINCYNGKKRHFYWVGIIMNVLMGQKWTLFFFFKRFYLSFRERGIEGEREGEKYQCTRELLIGCLL